MPSTDGAGDLQQGNLEQANVDAVTEISDLIAAQRAYEMNAQGHHRRRPDAVGHLQPDALRNAMIRIASLSPLALCARRRRAQVDSRPTRPV